jgi:pimeloyl-ACP methyl ester carboxylesterase
MVNITLGDVYGDRSKITDNAITYYPDMMLARGNRQSVIRLFEELEHMTAERVKHVKAPTLIMWGDKDRWIPPANAKLFARDIPGSEVIVYPGVGHIPMEEIPEQSAADAHQFLSRVLVKPAVSKPKKEAASAS